MTLLDHIPDLQGRGDERHAPCPMCGGKDRLVVNRPEGEWLCWCRQCDWGGDLVTWLVDVEHVPVAEAVERAGRSSTDVARTVSRKRKSRRRTRREKIRRWSQAHVEMLRLRGLMTPTELRWHDNAGARYWYARQYLAITSGADVPDLPDLPATVRTVEACAWTRIRSERERIDQLDANMEG